jgi:hypothetical protein
MFRQIFIVGFLILGACTTLAVDEGLSRVKTGMDKDSVLNLAGNPKRTYRADSKDHWIYTYFRSEREYVQSVTFENGRVTGITTSHILRAPSAEVDDETVDLNGFEQQMRDEEIKGRGEFKDVDDPSSGTANPEPAPAKSEP